MLIGMFVSKFDKKALSILGFKTFSETFNVLGLSLGVKPLSIRNYRDEFDPIFPNNRKGWHKRPMYKTRIDTLNRYKDLSIEDFSRLIKKIIYKNDDIDFLKETLEFKEDSTSTFAKRLITGQAAEQYFEDNFQNIEPFKDASIENTTKLGCGFDFKLNFKEKFYAVEVKGLSKKSGNIMLTEKEYSVANHLKEDYFIILVKNFIEEPFHEVFKNPIIKNELMFNKQESIIKQINWSAKV
jgi:hypothetical protein